MKENKVAIVLKEFTLPIIIIFLIAITLFFVLIPKIKQISDLKNDVDSQEQTISQLFQKLADLKTLSEAELFDSSSLLLETLPQDKDFYKVVMISKKVLDRNNVTLSSFKLSPGIVAGEEKKSTNVAQGSQQMAVNVFFSASFENLKKMFAEVNVMLPLTDIESLKFGEILEATESGNFFNMNGQMTLLSYWAPLPKTLDRPEKPLPKISTGDKKLIEELKKYYRFEDQTTGESFSSSVVVGKDNPF